jgi:hypothetical protein
MIIPVKKRFDILVTAANTIQSRVFELDKDILSIKGILVTADKDELLYYRGTQKIEINKEEFFPDNYESKLLMSGVNVAPNQKYYDIGCVPPGNGQIKVDYTDTDDGRTVFSPYRVSIYVNCEREDGA